MPTASYGCTIKQPPEFRGAFFAQFPFSPKGARLSNSDIHPQIGNEGILAGECAPVKSGHQGCRIRGAYAGDRQAVLIAFPPPGLLNERFHASINASIAGVASTIFMNNFGTASIQYFEYLPRVN